MPAAAPVLVLDLGNSRLKGALWRDDALHERFALPHDALLQGAGPLRDLPDGPVLACSVLAGERIRELEAALAEALGRPLRFVGRDVAIPLEHDYATPETLGMDRLVVAWAAARAFPRGVVVADAGSALTVDWVDGRGRYRGGAIAPGLTAIVSALKAAAPSLDWGALDTAAAWPGRDSASSCRVGVTAAARGMVRELFRTALATAGTGVPLVVTGGDAERVRDLWAPETCQLRPDLLLEGLGRLADLPPAPCP